jgi:hypothetical protein
MMLASLLMVIWRREELLLHVAVWWVYEGVNPQKLIFIYHLSKSNGQPLPPSSSASVLSH